MQSTSAAFTAEEKDTVRRIAHNLQVSWKRDSTLGNRLFTIGVSTIGGSDIIGINPGAIGSPGNYRYFDESDYVMSLAWERGFNMPTGGLTKALAEARLDNTSGRFTPRYMGGSSELYTAIQPRGPVIINAGFDIGGADITIPQFAGLITNQPDVDTRSKNVALKMADYVDFFQNRFLDQSAMFTGYRTDEWLSYLFQNELGMSTAQYDLDYGINVIPFGYFESGSRFSDTVQQLVEAENGHLYQDEEGIFRFENRQHWDSSPYTEVQKVLYTAQVINAEAPNEDHIVNVVEIRAAVREKRSGEEVFNLPTESYITVPANSYVDQFFQFDDPVLELTAPTDGGASSYYLANSASDGTGSNKTSSISVTNMGTFAAAVKYRFTNNTSGIIYITDLVLTGRVARHTSDLYYRDQDDSSVTAYQERVLSINNDFIQNASWAESYARMILNDFAEIENLQRLTIKANPDLQLGDLVSWQGKYWRIFDIKSQLSPDSGFTQELLLLQRTITSYFRIGISTIGGSDKIGA